MEKELHIENLLSVDVNWGTGKATITIVEAYDLVDAEGFADYHNRQLEQVVLPIGSSEYNDTIDALKIKYNIK